MRTIVHQNIWKTAGGRRGFALAEMLLAVCCVAMVLTPFVLYLRHASMLQHEGAERGRVLAWGAYQRQVVGQGIDPTQGDYFTKEHPLVAGRTIEGVQRAELSGSGAASQLVVLSNSVQSTGAGRMLAAAGLELRAGLQSQNAEAPALASPSQQMQPPRLSPVSGMRLQPVQFSGTEVRLKAESQEAGRVVVEFRRPVLRSSAVGAVDLVLSADDIAAGVDGEAWVEYAGTESSLQHSSPLEDGRLAWYVETGGEVVRHMPSERSAIHYTLDLGRPVLVVGTVQYTSGSEPGMDFRTVAAVRSGDLKLRIQWPDTILALFKREMPGAGRFLVEFQTMPGDNEALGQLVFGDGMLELWSPRSVLKAEAVLPETCHGVSATWNLLRQVISLPQPQRVSSPLVEGTPEAAGWFDFQATELEGLGRVGRLSAREGGMLGSGGSLKLELYP